MMSPLAPPTAPAMMSQRREAPAARLSTALAVAAPLISVVLLWAIGHPFRGVAGDGMIYLNRALADLDPGGVGRDLMFVHDGQSGYSIFRYIAVALVSRLWTGQAALVLAIVNSVAWLGAMLILARSMTAGRASYLLLTFVTVLPLDYGRFNGLQAGEILATPRSLAEACVLLALAAVLRGRWKVSIGLLILAAALHPIMSLAGFLAIAVILVNKDRRLLALGAVGLAFVAAAAFMQVPLFDRLLMRVDPDWQAILARRNPDLFPTLWPPQSFGRLALSVVTLLIASRSASGRCKHLLLAAAAVGPIGIALSIVFGDGLNIVLIEQVQLWRMEWLTSVMAAAALALCALSLAPTGTLPRLTLALLALGWLYQENPYQTGAIAGLALIAHLIGLRKAPAVADSTLKPTLIAFGLLLAALQATAVHKYFLQPLDVQPGQNWVRLIANAHLLAAPTVALALLWFFKGRFAGGRAAWAALALIAAVGLGLFWDIRTPFARMLQDGPPPADAGRLAAPHPGEVLWLAGETEVWALLRRGNWASELQGSGDVFSRRLTFLAHDRVKASNEAGLGTTFDLEPFTAVARYQPPKMTRKGVEALCARTDAPAWIVSPLYDRASPPSGIVTHVWQTPVPTSAPSFENGVVSWHPISAFAFAACAEQQLSSKPK